MSKTSPPIPLIEDDLLTWLDFVFPDKLPALAADANPAEAVATVYRQLGKRDVVDRLRAEQLKVINKERII